MINGNNYLIFKAYLLLLVSFNSGYFCAQTINYIEDISPINEDGTINVVIEIPAGTTQKWEISKTEGSLERELIDGLPRSISYLGYPGNYGIIPRTLLSKISGGDGDPLDVLLLGPALERGSVVPSKVIGKLNMIDGGEIDHKLIAVQKNSAFFEINSLLDLDITFPGVSTIIELWFKNYKGNDKIQINGFDSKIESMRMLEMSIIEYEQVANSS
tara:strand:- start:228 stop:872 length:645 start_codon:yes stop_codon:yes gene_type:complete